MLQNVAMTVTAYTEINHTHALFTIRIAFLGIANVLLEAENLHDSPFYAYNLLNIELNL